nr:hypothetical protein [uncultured Albidiferax sp.]
MPKRTTPAVRSVNTATPARRRPNILSSATPKLPHEQDQSVGMTDGIPSKTVQQAYRDVTQGQQDTDRGPEADRAYQKLKK